MEVIEMPLKHKHIILDQSLIEEAKEYIGESTDTEVIIHALKYLAEEAKINRLLKKSKGKTKIEKVYS